MSSGSSKAVILDKAEKDKWVFLIKKYGLNMRALSKETGYHQLWCRKKCEALFKLLMGS